MTLFKDHDADDDWIYVDTAPEVAGLFVKTDPGGAYLTPGKANELHAALGRWLSESGVTAQLATAPPTPSDQDFIRQVVHEEVARVLPLHLAPQAAECDGTACCQPHPVPEPLCGLIRPADAHAAARCTWCGHLWAEHAGSTTRTRCGQCNAYNDTPAPHVCEPEPEPQHGRLMSELPKRVRPKVCVSCGMPWPHVGAHPLHLCGCGHCSRQHAGSYGYGECGVAGCDCRRFDR